MSMRSRQYIRTRWSRIGFITCSCIRLEPVQLAQWSGQSINSSNQVKQSGNHEWLKRDSSAGFNTGDWVLACSGWQDYALPDGVGLINWECGWPGFRRGAAAAQPQSAHSGVRPGVLLFPGSVGTLGAGL